MSLVLKLLRGETEIDQEKDALYVKAMRHARATLRGGRSRSFFLRGNAGFLMQGFNASLSVFRSAVVPRLSF